MFGKRVDASYPAEVRVKLPKAHSHERSCALVMSLTLIALVPGPALAQHRGDSKGNSGPAVTEESLGKIDSRWIDYSLAISADGRHVAYVAKREGGKCVVLDDRPSKTYPDIPEQHLTERGRDPQIRFSPDGNHIAYVARRADGYVVVADGVEGKPYEYIEVGAPVFSSNSKRLAYVAKRNGRETVVVDGAEGKPFDYLGVIPLRFSPDGKHLGCVARRGNSDFAVIDGQDQSEGDYVGPITYSKGGSRYAYQVNHGESRRVVIDGIPRRAYSRLGNDVVFSDEQQARALSGDE